MPQILLEMSIDLCMASYSLNTSSNSSYCHVSSLLLALIFFSIELLYELCANILWRPSANILWRPSANILWRPSANILWRPSANILWRPSAKYVLMSGTLTIEFGFGSVKCPSMSGTLVVPQTLTDRQSSSNAYRCTTFLDISTPISLPSHHFLLLIHPTTSSF